MVHLQVFSSERSKTNYSMKRVVLGVWISLIQWDAGCVPAPTLSRSPPKHPTALAARAWDPRQTAGGMVLQSSAPSAPSEPGAHWQLRCRYWHTSAGRVLRSTQTPGA